MEIFLAAVAVAAAGALVTSLRILKEYERAVVFRLGRVRPVRGPGIVFLVPYGVERMERVSLRIIAMDIPPQDVITRDNVSVKVNAVLYFRVTDPLKAVLEIEDYLFATSQLAQTTLRSVIGQAELDEVLAEREKFNRILREIIDEGTDPWGIDVTGVEIKDVDLPQEMKRVIARQAEAERERRAKVINAEGELQAADKLTRAAARMSQAPASLQLRFLQTAAEVAAENNSTTLFPVPVELLGPLQKILKGGAEEEGAASGAADLDLDDLVDEEADLGQLSAGDEEETRSAREELSGSAEEERRRLGRGSSDAPSVTERIDKERLAERARRKVEGEKEDGGSDGDGEAEGG
jgi:regulator of protease activity HflC (stomatin/prohibitin superfamily)